MVSFIIINDNPDTIMAVSLKTNKVTDFH